MARIGVVILIISVTLGSVGCQPEGWRPLPAHASLTLPVAPDAGAGPALPCAEPVVGELVINEILARPGSIDADGDGVPRPEDEAIELVNLATGPVSLSGLSFSVNGNLRGALGPAGCLEAGMAVVVLGKAKASGRGSREGLLRLDRTLRLPDSGGTLTVVSAAGAPLDIAAWGLTKDAAGASWSRIREGDRDAPLAPTPTLSSAGGATHTLGLCSNGQPFPGCLGLGQAAAAPTGAGDSAPPRAAR